MKRLGLITAISIGVAAAVFAQAGQRTAPAASAVAQGDWQNINRDSGATRFSPLTQINVGNVAKLQQMWTFPGAGGSSVPVVVNGVMYLSAGRRVVAVDGDTGKEVWAFTLPRLHHLLRRQRQRAPCNHLVVRRLPLRPLPRRPLHLLHRQALRLRLRFKLVVEPAAAEAAAVAQAAGLAAVALPVEDAAVAQQRRSAA